MDIVVIFFPSIFPGLKDVLTVCPTLRIRIVHFILTHTPIHTGGEARCTLLLNPDTQPRPVIFLLSIFLLSRDLAGPVEDQRL